MLRPSALASLLSLALLACGDDAPPHSDGGVGLRDGGPPEADGGPPGVDAGCEPSCALAWPTFTVENRAATRRTEVVSVTLPFAPGVAPDTAALAGVSVAGVPAELVPLRWHRDASTGARGSIALAQLRVPLTLAPGERRTLEPVQDGAEPPPHALGPATAAWIGASGLDGARVHVTLVDGTTLEAPLFAPTFRALDAGRVTQTLRHRAHFASASGPHPLSLTTYATLDSGLDQGELVVLVGNDTLEQPVSGGVAIARLEVRARAPFRFALREPEAYGVTRPAAADDETWVLVDAPRTLADGASFVFRGRWAVSAARSGDTYDSFTAAVEARLFPLAEHAAWAVSGAAGTTGFLPPTRGTPEASRAAVEPECARAIAGTPVSHLGYLNLNPPSTGDQPDFASGVPLFALQAIESGSPCALRPAALAVDREALRPSFYWMQRDGSEDRVTVADFPSLFFWGGRIHFDPNQNPGQPLWLARLERNGFVVGDTHGWGGMDDQHYGNNALRAVYELTGDPYLRDVLVAHQTLLTWLFFTGYAPSVGAQRSMRLMKEALALYALDDTGPAAAPMRAGAEAKNRAVLAEARARVERGLSPAHGTVRNDARVTISVLRPEDEVVMGWQTGFHMEYQALALRAGWEPEVARQIVQLYAERADTFFREDGTPVTYFFADDPALFETGGIASSWWAGWMHLLPAVTGAPRDRLERARSVLCAVVTPPPGALYADAQRWHSYPCP